MRRLRTGQRGINKHQVFLFISLVLMMFLFTSCAAGPNNMKYAKTQNGEVAGFLPGLWHGFISLFTFVISLFSKKVNIYEIHNNGGWYNFGFILGIMIFYGSSHGARKKSKPKRKEKEENREVMLD